MTNRLQATRRSQPAFRQTVVLVSLLVMASDLATAQNEQLRKVAKPPMRAGPVVTEIASMLKSGSIRAKGMIVITSRTADCLEPSYSGEFEALGDPVPELPVAVMRGPAVFLSFLPGVQHKFIGHVCWPGPESALTSVTEKGTTGGDYRGDTVILDSPISITEGSFVIATQSRVFEIKSDASDPLVLQITPKGYKHISGKGTIRTPMGKIYSFRN